MAEKRQPSKWKSESLSLNLSLNSEFLDGRKFLALSFVVGTDISESKFKGIYIPTYYIKESVSVWVCFSTNLQFYSDID